MLVQTTTRPASEPRAKYNTHPTIAGPGDRSRLAGVVGLAGHIHIVALPAGLCGEGAGSMMT